MNKAVSGELWTQNQAWTNDYYPKLNVITSRHQKGLSKDKSYIHTGSNSGYQAINLAYHWGADRILLLGYDMKGKGSHFFGHHTSPGLPFDTDYTSFISHYNSIHPEHYGIEIINCTPNSALDCFPKASIDNFI